VKEIKGFFSAGWGGEGGGVGWGGCEGIIFAGGKEEAGVVVSHLPVLFLFGLKQPTN